MLVDNNLDRSFEANKINLFSTFCDYPCPPSSALIKPTVNSFSIETILGKRSSVPVDRGKSNK